jgi:hypothetical protein
MKKNELTVGNYYAYDRSRDTLPFSVTKVKLVSLESEKGYRAKNGTVQVEFPAYRWAGGDREEYIRTEFVQLYTLKGDYDTIANAIELRKKDREIQTLRGQIEKTRRVEVMNKNKQAFIDFGVSPWTFSDYRPDFTIAFSEAQFITVSKLLATYNKDLAEAQADALESNQLAHMIGSN